MPAEYRQAGSVPVEFVRVVQDTHESVDPPLNVFALGVTCGPCWGTVEMDYGDGNRVLDIPPAGAYLNPTTTSTHQTVIGRAELLLVSSPFGDVAPRLGLTGLAMAEALAPLHERMIGDDPLIQPLALAMWRSATDAAASSNLFVDQALLTLSLHLLGLARGTTRGSVRFEDGERAGVADRLGGSVPALDDVRVRRALELIEARLGSSLSLDALAAEVGLGPSHFARAFKRSLGEPVWRFVLHRRLDRARTLLETTPRPLADIALDCGFASQSHFGRAFARRYGVPPGRYRRGAR